MSAANCGCSFEIINSAGVGGAGGGHHGKGNFSAGNIIGYGCIQLLQVHFQPSVYRNAAKRAAPDAQQSS